MSNQMKNCLLRSNPIDTSRSSSRSSIDEVDSDLRRNRVFSFKRLSGVQDAVVTGKIYEGDRGQNSDLLSGCGILMTMIVVTSCRGE